MDLSGPGKLITGNFCATELTKWALKRIPASSQSKQLVSFSKIKFCLLRLIHILWDSVYGHIATKAYGTNFLGGL